MYRSPVNKNSYRAKPNVGFHHRRGTTHTMSIDNVTTGNRATEVNPMDRTRSYAPGAAHLHDAFLKISIIYHQPFIIQPHHVLFVQETRG